MKLAVSHSRIDESPEAKARWFQSLTLSERMEIFCYYTGMALNANPQIADSKDAKPASRRILILSKT